MNNIIWGILTAVVATVGLTGIMYRFWIAGLIHSLQQQLREAEKAKLEAENTIETRKKELLLEAKDEAYRLRIEAEKEHREKRAEIQRMERRLAQREEWLERRLDSLEKRDQELNQRAEKLKETSATQEKLVEQQRKELQRIAGLTNEEARQIILKEVEEKARHEASKIATEIEEEGRRDGERRARKIIVEAIQRCAVDQTSETTVSVVPLPNEEMKGRIIGREGRNIRTFETLTGVDLIIDDTPEAVVLSGFDPIRREIARIALTNLVVDGRIHPGRIEEMIAKATDEMDDQIIEAGEHALFETGVTGAASEIVRLLGKLKFRYSFGQNVLAHSMEVSQLCRMMASELDADVRIAKRAGLFHDLGKAVDMEVEGPHALITGEILRRHHEEPAVVLAAEAHHNDVEASSIEAALVIAADAISASRPGARRETLETYVKRLKQLEEIADSFEGVEKTFAVQAGREIRLIVKPDEVDDDGAAALARETARRIESEMQFPGQIKVTVIRETRAIEFAK